MRLLQAIVAGSVRAGTLAGNDDAVAWLETLEPPRIFAQNVRVGTGYISYVPRNSDDITLLGYYKDMPAYEVQTKRRARYDAQPTLRRWVSAPVTYQWRVDDVAAARRVGDLSSELVCLGRAEDLAFARFEVSSRPFEGHAPIWAPSLQPARARNPLRVPTPNSMATLVARQRARRARNESREYVDPFIAYDERSYECGTDTAQRPFLLCELRDRDGSGFLSWRHDQGVTVAAMIRHALATRVPASLRGYAMGHPDGEPQDRLSWIPLPSIDGRHADGRIRRAIVLGPEGESLESERFREIRHALAHAPLLQHGVCVGTIEDADDGDGAFRRFFEAGVRWHTVTPVVTHGRTTRGGPQKGKFMPRKAERLVLQALARMGLPEIAEFGFQSAPSEPSGRAASRYRVPSHLSSLSRFHVSVRFAEPVSGLVLAGVGRHYGLGLFCASRDSSEA